MRCWPRFCATLYINEWTIRRTVNDELGFCLAPSDAVLDAADIHAFIWYLHAFDLQHPVGHDEWSAQTSQHHHRHHHHQQQQAAAAAARWANGRYHDKPLERARRQIHDTKLTGSIRVANMNRFPRMCSREQTSHSFNLQCHVSLLFFIHRSFSNIYAQRPQQGKNFCYVYFIYWRFSVRSTLYQLEILVPLKYWIQLIGAFSQLIIDTLCWYNSTTAFVIFSRDVRTASAFWVTEYVSK